MIITADNRVSLVVSRNPQLHWKRSQVMLVDSLPHVEPTLSALDIERIIVDRCASTDEFLHFLAALPDQLAGDVMLVRDDGGAFLSATGRGGDRVMYALKPRDVDFYIETHGLIASPDLLARTA